MNNYNFVEFDGINVFFIDINLNVLIVLYKIRILLFLTMDLI